MFHSINLIVNLYPSTDVEYLEWSARINGSSGAKLVKYGYTGDINDIDRVMSYHCKMHTKASNSWNSLRHEVGIMP